MAAKRRMASNVGGKRLLKIEGVAEAIAEVERTLSRTTGKRLKEEVLVGGAKVIWSAAKRNVAALPVSNRIKQILDAEVAIIVPSRPEPYVIVGVSQKAGIKKLGSSGFIINPYWIEMGVGGAKRIGGKFAGRVKGGSADAQGQYSAPHPFFRPALSASRKGARTAIANGLKTLVQDVGKG